MRLAGPADRRPDEAPDGGPAGGRAAIRLDKWLWQARFLKARSAATALVAEGRLRVNGEPTAKPHRLVGAGDVLTFALQGRVRVVRVLAPGSRRGPAVEARALYEDLSASRPPDDPPEVPTSPPGPPPRA